MARLPLSGITVVSLEQAVAAPFATRQLADLGARVIKVERPGGGDFARRYDTTVHGPSSYFVWFNRSKESLTLDLKTPSGQEVLLLSQSSQHRTCGACKACKACTHRTHGNDSVPASRYPTRSCRSPGHSRSSSRPGNTPGSGRVARSGSSAFSSPPGSTLLPSQCSVRLEPCCAVRREATERTRSFFFHPVSTHLRRYRPRASTRLMQPRKRRVRTAPFPHRVLRCRRADRRSYVNHILFIVAGRAHHE